MPTCYDSNCRTHRSTEALPKVGNVIVVTIDGVSGHCWARVHGQD